MRSLKEKILSSYFKDEYLFEARLTPLRRFITSIGLDYTHLTRKQLYKWARSKRYQMFKKLLKIKRIADEANVDELLIYNNIELFLKEFYLDDSTDNLITEEEVVSFISLMEKIKQIDFMAKKAHQFGKRGSYKSKAERQEVMRNRTLQTINTGGMVTSGESNILYGVTAKKRRARALGTGKMMFLKRVPGSTGMKYHRKTYKVY